MITMADGLRVVIHSVLAFVGLLVMARIFGQKWLTLAGFGLAAMAGVASLQSRSPWTLWGLGALTWTVLGLVVQWLTIHSTGFAKVIAKQPTPLVQGGKVLEDNLRRSQVPVSQLLSMLRQKDAFSVADVEMGVLEPDGQLSVLLKDEVQPVTPKTLSIPVENQAAPVTLVTDGQVQPKAFGAIGRNRGWLMDELRRRGVTDTGGVPDLQQVVLAQVDGSGNLTLDLTDDAGHAPVTSAPSRPGTLATLKKAQADLESFCLETENPDAKALYQSCANSLQEVIRRTEQHLKPL
ncbi:MAG: DUF421 domain-containing protein [Alicyclobacillus sp.]|nr:DUF421 domain-containing protein [Alicyclobacillus sp.]